MDNSKQAKEMGANVDAELIDDDTVVISISNLATINAELVDNDTINISIVNRAGDMLEKTMTIGILDLVKPTVDEAQDIINSIARHNIPSTRAVKLYTSGGKFDAESIIESNFASNDLNIDQLYAVAMTPISTLKLMELTKRPFIPVSESALKELTSKAIKDEVHTVFRSNLGAYLLLTFIAGVPTLALLDDKITKYIAS